MNTRFDPREVQNRSPARSPFGNKEVPVVESATEARQGRKGSSVLVMLICGLTLAAVAWGGAEWWGQTTAPPAEQTATPPAGSNMPAGSSPAAGSNDPVIEQPAPTTNARPSGNP
jgi:hypothetical protein